MARDSHAASTTTSTVRDWTGVTAFSLPYLMLSVCVFGLSGMSSGPHCGVLSFSKCTPMVASFVHLPDVNSLYYCGVVIRSTLCQPKALSSCWGSFSGQSSMSGSCVSAL